MKLVLALNAYILYYSCLQQNEFIQVLQCIGASCKPCTKSLAERCILLITSVNVSRSPSLPQTRSKISTCCWSASTSSRTAFPRSARPSPLLPPCATTLVSLGMCALPLSWFIYFASVMEILLLWNSSNYEHGSNL